MRGVKYKKELIDMPYLTNIYLLTDHVIALKARKDRCVSFAALTFRILIRLNLKAPPFERERMFTCNVQWTCFMVLDLFQINALSRAFTILSIVISWLHGKKK
jgi:hypothetical protein